MTPDPPHAPTAPADVFVAPCPLGLGVFAARPFSPGDVILNLAGPVVPFETVLGWGDAQANAVQVGDTDYVAPDPPAVFVNHSCDPNAGFTSDRVLVAIRPIPAGSEVRFDYSTTMWEGAWTMPCRCGAGRCRGVVGDFPDLPPTIRREYLGHGVVQPFIVRRLRSVAFPSDG